MGAESYMSDAELNAFINGTSDSQLDDTVSKMMSNATNGIEGLPYQFMDSVDRRVPGSSIGRKYASKIFSQMPLLFLTPCEPLFMEDFAKRNQERRGIIESLLGSEIINSPSELLTTSGRYYSVDFRYDEYYSYLNSMLTMVAVYLGIHNEKININGDVKKILNINWKSELNDSFKTFFTSAENLIFYADSLNTVSDSFNNNTTESSLASTINGFSEKANELKFLFGKNGSIASSLLSSADTITDSIVTGLGDSLISGVAGGIVGSLAEKGVNTVVNGGKIIFPKVWSDSTYDKSYSFDIKLRSPDHDTLSIFLNVLKPYCKLLCLVMPRQIDTNMNGSSKSIDSIDPNAYGAPFLVKGYSKGMFSVDMGMITSLSVTKGAECCWNDDGLPTQIDLNITLEDLYSSVAMSRPQLAGFSASSIVNNTAYLDFLANLSGLNIAEMTMGRRAKMWYYLTKSNVNTSGSRMFTALSNRISRYIGKFYNLTS